VLIYVVEPVTLKINLGVVRDDRPYTHCDINKGNLIKINYKVLVDERNNTLVMYSKVIY
jgi:hypothetical protein